MIARRLNGGTAGWAIPRAVAAAFPATGTALERYAARFPAVEINSTFYRPHRASTFARWAAITPETFRFDLKVPRAVTHIAKLVHSRPIPAAFLENIAPLSHKLGPLLVQLPPSLTFDLGLSMQFLRDFRDLAPTHAIALEPRHASWFTEDADALLRAHRVARVAADPAVVPPAGVAGGGSELVYYRLHGSPHMYRSAYGAAYLQGLARKLKRSLPPTSGVCSTIRRPAPRPPTPWRCAACSRPRDLRSGLTGAVRELHRESESTIPSLRPRTPMVGRAAAARTAPPAGAERCRRIPGAGVRADDAARSEVRSDAVSAAAPAALNLERLQSFLRRLPPDGRQAMEFRHSKSYIDEVFAALGGARRGVLDLGPSRCARTWLRTASFVYVVGHGPGGT